MQVANGLAAHKIINKFIPEEKVAEKWGEGGRLAYRLLTTAAGGLALEGLRMGLAAYHIFVMKESPDYVFAYVVEPISLIDILLEVGRSVVGGSGILYANDFFRKRKDEN